MIKESLIEEVTESTIEQSELGTMKSPEFLNDLNTGEINSFEKADKSLAELESIKEELDELQDEYNNELKELSEYPETIKNTDLEDWNKISEYENQNMRLDYKLNKNNMIDQWEINNDKEWPVYNEEVYSKNGNLIRNAGDRYDAHHIKPLEFGGENLFDNLTPMHAKDHYDHSGIHSSDGIYGKIKDTL